MIKIYDLDGFKYVDFFDGETYRKNCTYIKMSITDWDTDKEFLNFLSVHIQTIEVVKNMIEKLYNSTNKKIFHIVIRQDDDIEKVHGKEFIFVSHTKPKGVKEHINYYKKTTLSLNSFLKDSNQIKRYNKLLK